jgi:hypothetical protein
MLKKIHAMGDVTVSFDVGWDTTGVWYEGIFDLLPVAGVLLHTGAFWLTDEKKISRVSLSGSPFWFVYNLHSQAYFSAVGDILTMISILVAMLRYRKGTADTPEAKICE